MRNRDNHRATDPQSAAPVAVPVLMHQLSERLTAASNYLKALQLRAAAEPPLVPAQSAAIVERVLGQLNEASQAFHRLQHSLAGAAIAGANGSRGYRVCFLNRFARGAETITACQRAIVIPAATSPEAAIEAAKQRFAELEGIPNWRIHASMIVEAGLLDDDAAATQEGGADP
jgi:hypothetical protein